MNQNGALGMTVTNFLDDPEGFIEPIFSVTPSIRLRVEFWMKIYSQYTSDMRVVHDRARPEIIYGVIDFTFLHRKLGENAAFESEASRIERKIIRKLKDLIALAQQTEVTAILPTKNIVPHFRAFLSKHGALDPRLAPALCANMRTQTGQSDFFLLALKRSQKLLPYIESILTKHGLPKTVGRIPFVESSFNERAQSKAGAVGIWQFTPETARQWISSDEERSWSDPVLQTRSAARLIRGYRSILPDWGTTITAYNSGIGRVRRLLQKHKIVTVEALINTIDSDGLGFAGKNFYAEVLAATLVEAYKERIFGVFLLEDSRNNDLSQPHIKTFGFLPAASETLGLW
jgi:membrane-bound lytic murein transglycosylase D